MLVESIHFDVESLHFDVESLHFDVESLHFDVESLHNFGVKESYAKLSRTSWLQRQ